jgi:uracil phosphoribosyltransferase
VEGDRINPANIVAVSIIRAGDSLLDCFMKIAPEAQVGKILIQRNETTKQPELFYSKLPAVASKTIMLLDPMLATGGSAKAAIQVLLDNGALESSIVFLNVVSCPEGIAAISKAYPAVQIVTAFVDSGLHDNVSSRTFSLDVRGASR